MSVRTLPFGELALLEDLITREQLHATLSYQAERRDQSKPNRKLGTLLVHQGFLTREEARAILRLQRDRGPIENYVLMERLGSGGMGTVFRAIQKSLEREVAMRRRNQTADTRSTPVDADERVTAADAGPVPAAACAAWSRHHAAVNRAS